MKRLQFDYCMKIHYSNAISACHFTLKCFPMQDARQQIISCHTEILPDVLTAEGTDSFGNSLLYGSIRSMHDEFSVHVSGEVALVQTEYEAEEKDQPFIYCYPYGMSRAGSKISEYYKTNFSDLSGDSFEKAIVLMHKLHQDFTYEKGCTDANTSAETAFSLGKGVCQDYAHIYIALCHLAGIPARYAAGILIGEGESHAWVEILHEDRWIGLDVTNDVIVRDAHLKFGHGRDAADCRMNTGIVYGTAEQTQCVIATAELFEQ